MSLASADINMLRHRSLGDEAASIIRERIMYGEYPQGMRLTEEGFSKSLGISRMCVKEAFLILESEGLVTRGVSNKYTEVARFDRQNIEDIMALRCAVELLCAKTCLARGIRPLGELKEQIKRISRAIHADPPDFIQYVEEDLRFHEIIVIASRNSRAINVWKSLESQVKTLIFSVCRRTPGNIKTVGTRGHDDIVKALASSDTCRVVSLLQEHIEQSIPLVEGGAEIV